MLDRFRSNLYREVMPKQGKLYIGTSGWNYNHWREHFYPEKLPSKKWLEYYIEKFDTVEINNTFYQLPKESALKNWVETTPDDFLFTVKASRYITHMKKLKDPVEAFGKFRDRVELLGGKLGPILFQLPPRWKANPERLEGILKILPKGQRAAFEFRDQSWWNEEIYGILKRHNAAFCIYELDGMESPKEFTADWIYLRMHGPDGSYEGSYSKQELAGWAGAITQWRKKGMDIYCYFDNDEKAHAVNNALSLKEMFE